MSRKIVHVITSLEGGGTENFLWQLLKYSPANYAHEVLFLKKDGVIGERIRSLGVCVQRTSAGSLWRSLRAEKPDIVHTCLYRAHQIGRIIGRLSGVKTIVSSQRAMDAWQKPWHLYLDSFTLQFCDQVIANSSAAETLVRHRIRQGKTPRVTRIFNGVDLERFSSQDKKRARSLFALPEDALIGGSLMRLHAEKGADHILPFAQKLLRQNPQLHLVIGGVGPMEQNLREQSQNQPWSARLHWLGWVEDTPAFYAALDFFWSLSREESFPQSLLEASVMGIPWLAPDVGGVPDLIAAGAPGVLYPPGNLEAAATLASDVIPKRGPLQNPGFEAFRQKFSVQEMAARFYHALAF